MTIFIDRKELKFCFLDEIPDFQRRLAPQQFTEWTQSEYNQNEDIAMIHIWLNFINTDIDSYTERLETVCG